MVTPFLQNKDCRQMEQWWIRLQSRRKEHVKRKHREIERQRGRHTFGRLSFSSSREHAEKPQRLCVSLSRRKQRDNRASEGGQNKEIIYQSSHLAGHFFVFKTKMSTNTTTLWTLFLVLLAPRGPAYVPSLCRYIHIVRVHTLHAFKRFFMIDLRERPILLDAI